MRVGVLGEGSWQAVQIFNELFGEMAEVMSDDIPDDISCKEPPGYDILVLLNDHKLVKSALRSLKSGAVALVNTDGVPLSALLGFDGQIVTFGFNSRACVTASSIADGNIQVCIQRSMLTLNGDVLQEQEFPVSMPSRDPSAVLAVCACALLCGLDAARRQ